MINIYYKESALRNAVDNLVTDLHLTEFEPDCIVGIARGGLIPATYISHELNLPLEIITWQTRDGSRKDTKSLLNIISNYKNVLFVDDICDSGLTIKEIKDTIRSLSNSTRTQKFYTMLHKKSCILAVPDYTSEIVERDDVWIDFFWEKKNG